MKLIPARVTPNQVTIFRFFTIPFVVLLLYLNQYGAGLILFIIAALSDAVDGAMARTRNQITQWGETYDPLADKLLIAFTAIAVVPRFLGIEIVFAIIMMEMLLIGFAYYRRNFDHRRVSANVWGKAKMIFQSVGVGFVLLYILAPFQIFLLLGDYILNGAVILALISLITYGI